MKAQVTILNSEGKTVYSGQAELGEQEVENGATKAMAEVPKLGSVRVWLVDGKWIGWV